MKRLFALLSVAALLVFGLSLSSIAQDEATYDTVEATSDSLVPMEEVQEEVATPVATLPEEPEEPQGFHQILKEQFIAGGAGFMGIVLLTLIFGLAICIERIIYLNLATTNTQKLLNKV